MNLVTSMVILLNVSIALCISADTKLKHFWLMFKSSGPAWLQWKSQKQIKERKKKHIAKYKFQLPEPPVVSKLWTKNCSWHEYIYIFLMISVKFIYRNYWINNDSPRREYLFWNIGNQCENLCEYAFHLFVSCPYFSMLHCVDKYIIEVLFYYWLPFSVVKP